jgi:ribonucleoside-diphosphate reductase alpha chain
MAIAQRNGQAVEAGPRVQAHAPDLDARVAALAASGDVTRLEGYRAKIFADRYALKDEEGRAVEEYPEQMWARVAKGVAVVEAPERHEEWSGKFYDALSGFRFVPGGRILSGAGSGHNVTWFNCFVIESPEDSVEGIFRNIERGAEIMRRSGGVGVNLSSLRPRGAYIKTVNGTSSGPCAWAILYSDMTGKVIQQGGSRRGK